MSGTLTLVGGGEWTEACTFDSELLSGCGDVLVIPAAMAYERPEAAVERARAHLEPLDVRIDVLDVYRRAQAMEPEAAAAVAGASAVYVSSGSPMHLRSVLKDTPLLDALVTAWRGGTVVAVAGEATSVLCTHMVDSRGGAFTVGLELVTTATFVPRRDRWSPDKFHRTVELAPIDLPVVGIDESTALVHTGPGEWSVSGAGEVQVFLGGRRVGLDALPRDLNPVLEV
jgi:cyanophycinase